MPEPARTEASTADWWRRAVVYQIYPRSFQDSNGDGVGDLEGIISRLDYLNDGTEKSLGVDAIWLSPTFPSPMADFGYDVSDYCGVDPVFGNLITMDRLITECHRRGIKVLLDYVPNHTSDRHPWFQESRSARMSSRRDWYIWRDPTADGSPPNNWPAVFGGPAWTIDPATGQYYLHSFLKEQPDLNWRNPEVVEAMHDVLRFWLRRGIDGFRMDVLGMVIKHPQLANVPENPDWRPGSNVPRYLRTNMQNYPDVFDAVRGIRRVLDEFPGAMAVGEVFGTPQEIAEFYGGQSLDGIHLAFNFRFINNQLDGPVYTRWDAATFRYIVQQAESHLPPGAQPCYAFGNHDRARIASRYDGDGFGAARARAAIILLLGLRSTPFIYYGDEIGMGDVDIPEGQLQDPARIRTVGRDPERTPMQWDAGPGRGFSAGKPWLPFGPEGISVKAQDGDPDSLLALYRRVIWLRKSERALIEGSYHELDAGVDVFGFERRIPGARPIAVFVNTSTELRRVHVPFAATVILATHAKLDGLDPAHQLHLPPLAAVWLAGASR